MVLEVWSGHLGEWHGQLRDTDTGTLIGEEWIADQRGAVIGEAYKRLPLTRLPPVVDVAPPNC